MDWLRHHTTEESQSAPAQVQHTSALSPQTANTLALHYAARTRDPNAPENKYQVNQQCIYERRLPGGSYITAHLQRLQSGYYDSPVIHEDLIDNVRFVALNFVFHPSKSHFRFKYAEIRLALHDNARSGRGQGLSNGGQAPDPSRHEHATQTSPTYVDGPDGSVIRYMPSHQHRSPKPVRPKFLRHAPHLMYGAVSPETLDWNFNVAGSVGVTQGPATASFAPSGGMKGNYKIYDMMKIQGSVRTLRSWYGRQYDIEDGEIVWTLEENKLQQSGLPREFTFVVLLTKGTSTVDIDDPNALTLDVDIDAKVAGFVGKAAFPNFVTNMRKYRPFRYPPVDLDLEVGQVFEPTPQASQQTDSRQPADPNTINLRVFIETARDSTRNLGAPASFLHLRPPPPRTPSPLPPASIAGSHRSHKRTLTITSVKQQSGGPSGSSAAPRPRSYVDGERRPSHSLRKARSRSELNSEYNSSPIQEKATLANFNSEAKSSVDDLPYSLLPVDHLQAYRNLSSNKENQNQNQKHHFEPTQADTQEQDSTLPQHVQGYQDQGNPRAVDSRDDHYHPDPSQAAIGEEDSLLPQPDSETLPQQEFHKPFTRPVSKAVHGSETPAALHAAAEQERHVLDPASPRLTTYSTTDGTGEWLTPPERASAASATIQSSRPLSPGQTLTIFSQTGSSLYYEQPRALSAQEVYDDGATADDEREHSSLADAAPREAQYVHLPIRRKPLLYHSEAAELPGNYYGGNDKGIQGGNARDDESDGKFASRLQRQQNRASADGDVYEHDAANEDASPDSKRQEKLQQPRQEQNNSSPPSSRPSYPTVQEALRLALAEHEAGAPPGSSSSYGFVGSSLPPRSTATSAATFERTAPASLDTATSAKSAAAADSSRATTVVTPPLTPSNKRDSMSEATGTWSEDTPPGHRARSPSSDQFDGYLT
ncbi:hypothetical protein DV738_g4821, partial [Chaetothyriales sp. CBS 135597]